MSDQPMSSTIIKTILGFFCAWAKEPHRANTNTNTNGGFIRDSVRRGENTLTLGASCRYLARSWNKGDFHGSPLAFSNLYFAGIVSEFLPRYSVTDS